MKRQLSCVALVLMAACSTKKDPPPPAPAADASPAPAAASTPTTAPTGSAAGAKATSSYAGKYTVAAGTMYIPSTKDWSSAKFKNDESKLLGDGDLSLAIDGDGVVTGSTDGGPLGASTVSGTSDGSTVTAAVRRKDAKDDGLTGTLLAKLAGDKLEGTMNLSDGQSVAVRAASFTLAKK